MSNKLPEEPDLKEAFIKEMFLGKGIKPQDVDDLEIGLINDMIEIRNSRIEVKKIKDAQQESMRNLQYGRTTNQSETRPGYQRLK